MVLIDLEKSIEIYEKLSSIDGNSYLFCINSDYIMELIESRKFYFRNIEYITYFSKDTAESIIKYYIKTEYIINHLKFSRSTMLTLCSNYNKLFSFIKKNQPELDEEEIHEKASQENDDNRKQLEITNKRIRNLLTELSDWKAKELIEKIK